VQGLLQQLLVWQGLLQLSLPGWGRLLLQVAVQARPKLVRRVAE